MPPLTPVPLTVFRSNSKLDQNFESSSLKYTEPITKKILHTSRQLHCRDVCKIPMWSVEYILNQNTAYFGRISNSIEISSVGRVPGWAAPHLEAWWMARWHDTPHTACPPPARPPPATARPGPRASWPWAHEGQPMLTPPSGTSLLYTASNTYRKVSNISRTKSQNLNASRLIW